jgi:hypothetical protein
MAYDLGDQLMDPTDDFPVNNAMNTSGLGLQTSLMTGG